MKKKFINLKYICMKIKKIPPKKEKQNFERDIEEKITFCVWESMYKMRERVVNL